MTAPLHLLDDIHAPVRIGQMRMTAAEFDVLVTLPDHADRILEWIDGEVYEMPSSAYASWFSSRMNRFLATFVDAHNLDYVTGEAGGYMVAGARYAPDVAFISFARSPQLAQTGYHPVAPDLAIEVDHPPSITSAQILSIKIANYLLAGTVVWVLRPALRTVEVYTPGHPVRLLSIEDTLEGDLVLPGFSQPVRDIFPLLP